MAQLVSALTAVAKQVEDAGPDSDDLVDVSARLQGPISQTLVRSVFNIRYSDSPLCC
jgi:hypothetical protein